MEASEFIAKLKVEDTAKDFCDLRKVVSEYRTMSAKLPPKDLGLFSLNVLCTLCRNLDKAPLWRDCIDNYDLLTLAIACIRETRTLEKAERVKTLACIYHIHKYAVRQNKPIPSELILKISFMPFELESQHLLQEYYKTYGNILIDRISYMEKLKTKVNIIKFLPKLTEDIFKVIDICKTVEFVSNILVYLIKKLYLIYSAHAKELSQLFVQIFTKISMKNDFKLFKNLTDKELLSVYVKLNDCIYVVTENAFKVHFKDCQLDVIVSVCITMVHHSPDLIHCLQTFYMSSLCCLLKENTTLSYKEVVLKGMLKSFETTEKMGYHKASLATYPFLSQILRLYIEYYVTNYSKTPWVNHFNLHIQKCCLKLIQFYMKTLENCEQLTKCENCRIGSGLHDSLRLSFLMKNFVTLSLTQNILITDILPIFYMLSREQHVIVAKLNKLGCASSEKFFRKLQTDIHNTAITLNKAQYYEFAIKLFKVYLHYELKCEKIDHRNVSRALYNKSICELDCKLYENALIDAYLSLIFAQDLNTDKYMSLVMDIKAKELQSKSSEQDEEVVVNSLQLLSVLDACKMALDEETYEDLMPFISEIKFSVLLKHEFTRYGRLWPATAPVGGVWRSLLALAKGQHDDWVMVEPKETIERLLYGVVLETPSVVRTIHVEYFTAVVDELLDTLNRTPNLTPDLKLMHATLLLLRFEYDLAEANHKYKWKTNEPLQSLDPDQVCANRTIPQEHGATARAILALKLLTRLLPEIHLASKSYLEQSLQIVQVFVPQLLLLSRDVEGLQLAHICCTMADIVNDQSAYLRNLGTILYRCTSLPDSLDPLVVTEERAEEWKQHGELFLVFLCDLAIHLSRGGSQGEASRLLLRVQGHILNAYRDNTEHNFELAEGKLLEAQMVVCSDAGPNALTVVNGIQRHYLSMSSTGSKWSARRLHSLSVRLHSSLSSLRAARLPRALLLWRRARGAAVVVLEHAAAAKRTALYAEITDPTAFDDAQIKIDNRLKHALGLQPSNETQPYYATPLKKPFFSSPKQELEPMRDNMVLKKTQTSPSLSYMSVPAFKIPDFFNHSSICTCYACEVPFCFILACKTSGLEAAMYSKANETQIAKNYFDGVMRMFTILDKKMLDITQIYKNKYEDYIVESVMEEYNCELKRTQIEVLMELSLFELKNKNYGETDEYIVRIHEIMSDMENIDKYLLNEVMNLMTVSARLKKTNNKPNETGLETEFESLRLSPTKDNTNTDPPKTPESKPTRPPKPATKMIVKDEELPKKRKVIKLHLEDESSDERDFEKPTRSTRKTKKTEFKIPKPTTSKASLELATPRPTRSAPKIIITQQSEGATPKQQDKTKNEFFTPIASPDQFFTPMTSVKTYTSKKSLRHNIVKNLEQEFSTPKTVPSMDKENASTSSKDMLKLPGKSKTKSAVQAKKMLKRATSPGKLCKEKQETGTRSRLLRQHVNFSVEEDDRK